jgi:hypothetical protein
MAVGEAWQALGAILDGEPVQVNVELSFGFRCGDDVSSSQTSFTSSTLIPGTWWERSGNAM